MSKTTGVIAFIVVLICNTILVGMATDWYTKPLKFTLAFGLVLLIANLSTAHVHICISEWQRKQEASKDSEAKTVEGKKEGGGDAVV
jgi:hypothetical protein